MVRYERSRRCLNTGALDSNNRDCEASFTVNESLPVVVASLPPPPPLARCSKNLLQNPEKRFDYDYFHQCSKQKYVR